MCICNDEIQIHQTLETQITRYFAMTSLTLMLALKNCGQQLLMCYMMFDFISPTAFEEQKLFPEL